MYIQIFILNEVDKISTELKSRWCTHTNTHIAVKTCYQMYVTYLGAISLRESTVVSEIMTNWCIIKDFSAS